METLLGYVLKDVVIGYISGFELWCLKLTCKLSYEGIPFSLVKQCLKRDIYDVIKNYDPESFDVLLPLLKQGIIKISGTSLRGYFAHNWKGLSNLDIGDLNIYVHKSVMSDKKSGVSHLFNNIFAKKYVMEDDSLQYITELTDTFGIFIDQDLHIKSFDYFCNGVATVRTRNFSTFPEFARCDVDIFHVNNISMSAIVDDKLFGHDLVIINKEKYTYKGKVYHKNIIIPKNNYDYYCATIQDAAANIGLRCICDNYNIIDVSGFVIFMEYVNDARFLYHTRLFDSHVD